MRSRCLWLLVLFFVSFGLLSAAPRTSPHSAIAPKAISDSQVEQDLKARLARSKLSAKKFQFRVQGGVATLTGQTDIIQHKGIMTRMAKAAGARAVINNIQISEAARAKAAAKLESGRRKALVKHQPAAMK